MKRFLVTAALVAATLSLQAQKKPLDHSVFDSWQSIGSTSLSPDGSVIAYEVNPQEGDGALTIRSFGKKGREIHIPRGYNARILDNSRFAVCLIKPEFQKTRRAKIDKKKADDMPKDSLAVVNLTSGEITKFPGVKGYKMGKHAVEAFAFSTADTTFIPKAERKKKDKGGPVAVYHFADGHLDTLRNIKEYVFSKDGSRLALVRQLGKFKTEAGLYTLADGKATFFGDTTAWHGAPRFNEDGTSFLVVSAPDTLSSGSKHGSLYRYADGKLTQLVSADAVGIPAGWGITEKSYGWFSHDGHRIFVGV